MGSEMCIRDSVSSVLQSLSIEAGKSAGFFVAQFGGLKRSARRSRIGIVSAIVSDGVYEPYKPRAGCQIGKSGDT